MNRIIGFLVAVVLSAGVPGKGAAEVTVTQVDLARQAGFEVNAAGPILVQSDSARNRVIVANTLSSSVTVIDGETDTVTNVPIGRRGLQHLKAAALAVRQTTGTVYLVATNSLVVVEPDTGSATTIPTERQFESVAVDEATGNAFVCGRESREIGFFDVSKGELRMQPWQEHAEPLANLNQTPPPPSRRVVALPSGAPGRPGEMIAVDADSATLYVFDAGRGEQLRSRPLDLQPGGRWHLAGINPDTRHLYLVIETTERRVIQAAKIDVDSDADVIVPLPENTEGVGMAYHPGRDQIYVNYDNHPTIRVVDFDLGGALREIAIPAFGNDAAVLDVERDLLYVASWAHGEVDVVDVAAGRFVRKIEGLGIIPHMFTMTLNTANGMLYFPVGASAVNGCFGAAVTRLDPGTGKAVKIRTGWAPIDLIEVPERSSVLVFNNEDRMAEVEAGGGVKMHTLPHAFPTRAVHGPSGRVYLAYGPHQSYWPTVYIWAARNGVLSIDPDTLNLYDRRIPRQPLDLAVDQNGVLYLPQNNWGGENQFINILEDGVRNLEIGKRIELPDKVTRETTQRVLRHDPAGGKLLLLRAGERDDRPSVLQVIDVERREVVRRVEVGHNATDLTFDEGTIYVANFDSDTVSVVDRASEAVATVSTGRAPLKLVRQGERVFVLSHLGASLQEIDGEGKIYPLPLEGTADNVLPFGDKLVVTAHSEETLTVLRFDPVERTFARLHADSYPYGETRFDTHNAAFYMSGQFGDAVFTLTRGIVDGQGRLWLADFLSGRVYLIEDSATH
jgi:YVTN family beta-propeller protein